MFDTLFEPTFPFANDLRPSGAKYACFAPQDNCDLAPPFSTPSHLAPSPTWSSSSATASPSCTSGESSWRSTPVHEYFPQSAHHTLEEMDYKAAVVFLTQLAEQVDQQQQHQQQQQQRQRQQQLQPHYSSLNKPLLDKAYYLPPPPPQQPPPQLQQQSVIKKEENYDVQLKELMENVSPTRQLYNPNEQLELSPPPRRKPTAAQLQAALPPRPPNAFILYRRQQQAHLRRTRPGLHLRLASKLIANWWKLESEEVKAHYKKAAENEKQEHMKKYPGYRYRPRLEGRKRKDLPGIMGLLPRKRPEDAIKRQDMFDALFQMPDDNDNCQ